jgi:alkylated DNA repair dioxygenase AlkB
VQQGDLFGGGLPPGLALEHEFLSRGEERALLDWIATLPFEAARYKGYTARRRIVSYGGRYDFDALTLEETEPVPPALWPLRERVAAWAHLPAMELANALVAEYAAGTPLGWHRDVPDYESVVGVSLLGDAVMRLRRYPPTAATNREVLELALPPRSIYSLQREARWGWQHAIAATRALRYSITFRTKRQRGAPR